MTSARDFAIGVNQAAWERARQAKHAAFMLWRADGYEDGAHGAEFWKQYETMGRAAMRLRRQGGTVPKHKPLTIR